MDNILDYLNVVESFDTRQQSKVLHKLSEIIGISLFAMIANANEPEEIEIFSKCHESFLREYFVLANGIPSHDTIERAFDTNPHLKSYLNCAAKPAKGGYSPLWQPLV
jgi:hypothetical protein